MNWLLSFLPKRWDQQSRISIGVGTRIKHPVYGDGTVAGGCISVKFDVAPQIGRGQRLPSEKTACFNLNKLGETF